MHKLIVNVTLKNYSGLLIMGFLIFVYNSFTFGQESESTNEWNIGFRDGSAYEDAMIDSLQGSLLSIRVNDIKRLVPVESIIEIREENNTSLYCSLAGLGIGLTTGFLLGKSTKKTGALFAGDVIQTNDMSILYTIVGSTVGAMLGYFIGLLIEDAMVYDLSEMNYQKKLEIIRGIPIN